MPACHACCRARSARGARQAHARRVGEGTLGGMVGRADTPGGVHSTGSWPFNDRVRREQMVSWGVRPAVPCTGGPGSDPSHGCRTPDARQYRGHGWSSRLCYNHTRVANGMWTFHSSPRLRGLQLTDVWEANRQPILRWKRLRCGNPMLMGTLARSQSPTCHRPFHFQPLDRAKRTMKCG